jgi:phosphoglycolate phosphatase-like HAD superfamily hydrolase
VSRHVVLFDIDGTLLTFDGPPPGPGRMALNRAMHLLHGVERATDGMRVAGGTDFGLARALLERAGIAVDPLRMERLLATYLEQLRAVLESRRYRPIGEVGGCVEKLRAAGAVVGLATGNLREGARYKLASAGIDGFFDLEMGGYGSDDELRERIVRVGAARCGLSATDTLVVVGDTDRDVLAGHAAGAFVVGVAATDGARSELVKAGADVIVEGCGDALVEAILKPSGP